jgi:hypothetical protein
MRNTRPISVVLAASVAACFALCGPSVHAEPTFDASSYDNFAESAERVLDYIVQSEDYSINDRAAVAMQIQGLMIGPALMGFAGSPDKTTAQIKDDTLKNLKPLDGLTARELLQQINNRQKSQIADVTERIYFILDELRANSPSPNADYVDISQENKVVRFEYAPDRGYYGSLLWVEEDCVVQLDQVPLDTDFLRRLENRNLIGRRGEYTNHNFAHLKAAISFEKQFKEWEEIAKSSPTPAFMMMPDGKRITSNRQGEDIARGDRGSGSASGQGYNLTPAFQWDGDKATLMMFIDSGHGTGTVTYDAAFFSKARQLLGAANSLKATDASIATNAAKQKAAIEKSINERFKVGGAKVSAGQPTAGSTHHLRSEIKYRAKLSAADLRNSKGVFLPDIPNIQARDILLQDRFNYHQRGIRDPEDTNEGLYEEGKETMRKFFEGKVARLADGGDPMPLLSSEPIVDVTLTENEIVLRPVE